ncbi:MAG: hypothetical protein AAAB16_18085, partial [Pseudomonas sp.]|uniref:hypothetical protein n=1 Tax=Pseudomonas sp. TaxID=306 RepID=UPI0030F0C0C1
NNKFNPGGYLYAVHLSEGGKRVATSSEGGDMNEVAAPYIRPQDIVFGIGPLFLQLGTDYRLAGGQLFLNPDAGTSVDVAQQAFEKTKYLIDYGHSGANDMEKNMSFKERYQQRDMLKNEIPDGAE